MVEPAVTTGELLEQLTEPPTSVPAPVTVTAPQLLPFDQLTPENFERLVLRLAEAHIGTDVVHAQLYGVPGQSQGGIDLYLRLANPVRPDRPYVSVQCRNVVDMGPAAIREVADDFLGGDWADRSECLVLATRASLRDTNRANAVESAATALRDAGQIWFRTWDQEVLSATLRDKSDIVTIFFGPVTAELYCVPKRPEPSLRLVAAADPVALGVHRAISTDDGLHAMPTYVPRDADAVIAELLSRPGREQFALVIGPSSTGKSRYLLNALQLYTPDWQIFHPVDVRQLADHAASLPDQTIVWLDEFYQYLTGGLDPSTVRQLTDGRRIVVVGTMWPERFHEVRALPHLRGKDPYVRERQVLDLARVVDLPPELSVAERAAAREIARQDPRIAQALTSPFGLTQALAAAPDLVHRWRSAPDPYCRAVINAAIDARRLGASAPLTRPLLSAGASGYLSDHERGRAPADWFDGAIAYAAEELHGAASVLRPVATVVGEPDGYALADYLEQEGGKSRGTVSVPGSLWRALRDHGSPADLVRFAEEARQRSLYRLAFEFHTAAATQGTPSSSSALYHAADLLSTTGRVDDAKRLDLKAMELAGHPFRPPGWIPRESRRVLESTPWSVARERARHVAALWPIREMLERGEVTEARTRLQGAAENGNENAAVLLGQLFLQYGDIQQALAWFLSAIGTSHIDLYSVARAAALYRADGLDHEADELLGRFVSPGDELRRCVQLLSENRIHEAIASLQERAARGDISVWWPWAMLQVDAYGIEDIAAWLVAASDGDDGGDGPLIAAELWAERRELTKMRTAYEAASAADCPVALTWCAAILAEAGAPDDTLEWLDGRVESGDSYAIWPWARLLVDLGRVDEAVSRLVDRANAGYAHAIWPAACLLTEVGRNDEAETLLVRLISAGEVYALWPAATLAAERSQTTNAIDLFLRAAECGDTAALDAARQQLEKRNRAAADQLIKFGLEPGPAQADPWTAG